MTVRAISYDDYLKALGLWTLAIEHEEKAEEFTHALDRHLGLEDYSRLADEIYSGKSRKSFDEALALADIQVAQRADPASQVAAPTNQSAENSARPPEGKP